MEYTFLGLKNLAAYGLGHMVAQIIEDVNPKTGLVGEFLSLSEWHSSFHSTASGFFNPLLLMGETHKGTNFKPLIFAAIAAILPIYTAGQYLDTYGLYIALVGIGFLIHYSDMDAGSAKQMIKNKRHLNGLPKKK
jgi:ABC-type polysaccharide transport system permease subunit